MSSYLNIFTNVDMTEDKRRSVLSAASKLVSEISGKPESYVQVVLHPKTAMLFGGTDAPTAALELKCVRLPLTKVSEFSFKLCTFMEQQLQIPKDRVYVHFVNFEPSMWGWRGGVF